MSITVISYRPNMLQCALGYYEAGHDSELELRSFEATGDLTNFLTASMLMDLRFAETLPGRKEKQYTVLINGNIARYVHIGLEPISVEQLLTACWSRAKETLAQEKLTAKLKNDAKTTSEEERLQNIAKLREALTRHGKDVKASDTDVVALLISTCSSFLVFEDTL